MEKIFVKIRYEYIVLTIQYIYRKKDKKYLL